MIAIELVFVEVNVKIEVFVEVIVEIMDFDKALVEFGEIGVGSPFELIYHTILENIFHKIEHNRLYVEYLMLQNL